MKGLLLYYRAKNEVLEAKIGAKNCIIPANHQSLSFSTFDDVDLLMRIDKNIFTALLEILV